MCSNLPRLVNHPDESAVEIKFNQVAIVKCYFCANRHASVICHTVEKKLEVEFANVLRKEGYDRHTK